MRAALGLVALLAVGTALVSGGSRADSVRYRYLPATNVLRTVGVYGTERVVTVNSLGDPGLVDARPGWLTAARPLGARAPVWARRMYERSLLVLRALTNRRTGAVVAGARDGWAYVWPRDAGAVALAFASAGYRAEARRIAGFLLGLDLGAAARFHADGSPIEGRDAQGDAAGWVSAAARSRDCPTAQPRCRGAVSPTTKRVTTASSSPTRSLQPPPSRKVIRRVTLRPGGWRRRRSGTCSALPRAGLCARRKARTRGATQPSPGRCDRSRFRLSTRSPAARCCGSPHTAAASGSSRPKSWGGGNDPWTAPTAWTAWSLAALGERQAALRLMAELRRAATPGGMLPERVDAHTGIPTSTTPLAWSHAFAILALRQLWP